eukprot:gene2462-13322_t
MKQLAVLIQATKPTVEEEEEEISTIFSKNLHKAGEWENPQEMGLHIKTEYGSP